MHVGWAVCLNRNKRRLLLLLLLSRNVMAFFDNRTTPRVSHCTNAYVGVRTFSSPPIILYRIFFPQLQFSSWHPGHRSPMTFFPLVTTPRYPVLAQRVGDNVNFKGEIKKVWISLQTSSATDSTHHVTTDVITRNSVLIVSRPWITT